LERLTGLSRATVAALTTDLIASGILEENGPVGEEISVRRTGRPAQLLSIQNSAAYAIGVDIGHDQTRVMLCDVQGTPVWDKSVPQDVDHMPEQVLGTASEMIQAALDSTTAARERTLGIGVGIASPVDAVNGSLASESIMVDWRGVRPAHELSCRTGLPAQLINDANAGALAERLYGAARNCDNVVYVRLSAGIGAGIVANGQLLLGGHGLTGEIGHLQVDPDGRVCRCGNRGCLETVASPVAIANLLTDSWRRLVTTEDLFELVRSGNEGACRAVTEAADAVGKCIAAVVTLLDPELIVVGGELAAAGELLFDPMTRSIRRYRMPSKDLDVQVISGTLGDSAAARGAAGVVLAAAPESLAQSAPA
jgi:predicted NBD/HSP70 family sugar kinase